jgi:hypothetical protein
MATLTPPPSARHSELSALRRCGNLAPAMRPLESYLRELRDIRSSGAGVEEESYYTPLANLLNEAGKGLKPRVRCIMQLGNRGAGKPDGGLFTPDQFPKKSHQQPLQGQKPSRGAIEVKPVKDDAFYTAESHQVTVHWADLVGRSLLISSKILVGDFFRRDQLVMSL